jgi:predicted nucleic acid-binding protein
MHDEAASVIAACRNARGARTVDLMIAAIACSVNLPLHTRNPDDFAALKELVEVIAV